MSDYAERYGSIPKDLAKHALYSQTACNASGLIHSLDELVTRLWEQARREGHGTDWVNEHPVVVLITTQLVHLSRADSFDRWQKAVAACEAAAGVSLADV